MSEPTARPAPSGAKDQVARLLTLVPYLHARDSVRLDEAATALGVSPQQLLRDLKVLLMCGLPGGYPDDLIDVDLDALEDPDGDGVIRVSNADYLSRPMRLTPTEASAVIVALRALRNGAGAETRQVVDRALAKLEAAAAEAGAARIDPGRDGVDADTALLARRLQEAATARRQVRLTYFVPARDEESERVVDPRGVVTAQGRSYLDAYCHSADAPRLFRLDRISAAEVLDSTTTTDPAPPRDLSEGLLTRSSATTVATLELAAPARWVVDYYPVEDVRPQGEDPDALWQVDLLVADQRWLTRLLLRLAPHARLVVPAEFTDSFHAEASRTLGLYEHLT